VHGIKKENLVVVLGATDPTDPTDGQEFTIKESLKHPRFTYPKAGK
jgi:hypothetical protein